MSGEVDHLLRVVVPDIAAYDEVYKKLIRTPDWFDVSSSFAMGTDWHNDRAPAAVHRMNDLRKGPLPRPTCRCSLRPIERLAGSFSDASCAAGAQIAHYLQPRPDGP